VITQRGSGFRSADSIAGAADVLLLSATSTIGALPFG
jgi:hypothetical protein